MQNHFKAHSCARTPLSLAILLACTAGAAAAETTTIAPILVEDTVLSEVQGDVSVLDKTDLEGRQRASGDTAELLLGIPGVSLNGAGGLSSLPSIRGLADDRLRIKIDGMDLISTCPNHMNPPLSYLDPSSVEVLEVYPGVSPVSMGGDSIGGSILVETTKPAFAPVGETLTTGRIGARYASNGDEMRANLSLTQATDKVSVSYTGSWARAGNYDAADNFKTSNATGRPGHTLPLDEVGSTAYESFNHALSLGLKAGEGLLDMQLGYQNMPYQLYPNQRMDLLDNEQKRVNIGYQRDAGWGEWEFRTYYEEVDHYMNFGDDKQLIYGTAVNGMPMYSASDNLGASFKARVDLDERNALHLGTELQHYQLDDWWPPSGTGNMSPGTFENIDNGERDRYAWFAEWEHQVTRSWQTLLGIRYERVNMDADPVQGYAPTNGMGMMMNWQLRDATAFNAEDRSKQDNNIDLSALASYMYDDSLDIEFGLARKVRSPNLYERYTWSTWPMAAVMNNVVGDGNGYVGDIDLKPEKAHTASVTFDWHAPDRQWWVKATPYYTRVTDYIDVIQWNPATNMPAAANTPGQFNVLKYTNQSARLYGIDIAAEAPLGRNGLGDWRLNAVINYTNGKNRDTGDALYNIMPLNATFTLQQAIGAWENALELTLVDEKDDLSSVRNEVATDGYTLVNLRASRQWRNLRLDFGVENLFDTAHDLPTGGTYTGQGPTMMINGIPAGIAVPGPGRSLYAGFALEF